MSNVWNVPRGTSDNGLSYGQALFAIMGDTLVYLLLTVRTLHHETLAMEKYTWRREKHGSSLEWRHRAFVTDIVRS